ncbi:glycoside hydrolase family 2 [Curtobacterium sp. MCJR17_055]|uniref:glycoside hydrolase family 2 TIM barrel-domain containing protein n=1 Tax=unclassified Curtobacterium TaxID=257496 RepID=UPI000DA03AB4|nr:MULTISPECIES: glycoside hydrolase family 2 TIM barrel-domain containing protein [unclassified Curtobacterium]PYY37871.1 glycoside hydrolase family 2 [Curtobacterium sp. MCBD17_029]PYY56898.1 glycoside hydrolase family 2 [Curtobacterium sp. MCJR17_055]PYY62187.1 glycoside hydrolase family 2 [Curtobacterium sp. MCPF17_015]
MTTTSFNLGWTVRPKVSPYAQLQNPQDAGVPVTLPHDATITRERSADEPQGGRSAYFPGGAYEYTKVFDVPAEYRGKRVSVEFEGVYRDAMVFVNGAFAAQRPSGYSTFVVELDPYLRYGEANTIRVDARTHDDSRWYTGAGIYRDTTLNVTDLVHIAPAGLRVSTPDIEPARAVVEVSAEIRNDSAGTRTVVVATDITDATGAVVARGSSPVTVRAGGSAVARQRLYVTRPSLWSVETPTLYRATTRVTSGGTEDDAEPLDVRETPFGVRTLQLDPEHGLRINGESVKLRGACVHHDNGILGAATIARAEERRIEILKRAGFNAIRSSHNPLSPAMLDACDRLGMLVMDETFDMWTEGKSTFDYALAFPEWWERDVEALVAKDHNHPSVVFYSIGNEILETGDPLGSEWGRRLAEKVRSLDHTRFVTNGINGFVSVLRDVVQMMQARGGDQAGGADGGVNGLMNSAADFMNQVSASPLVTSKTEESFSVLDVAGLNYGDARYVVDKDLFPDRVIVGSETFPPQIARYWRLVEDNAHVLGDFTWAGWDYLGEVGIGRVQYTDEPPAFEAPFPWITAWVGDIDISGHRRTISYYRETVFGLRHEPYIAVLRPEHFGRPTSQGMWAWSDTLSSWTFDVPDGTMTQVEVYSDADEVEILVNGVSAGRQPAGRDHAFLARFDVPYARGEITAIGYTGGREHSRSQVVSASERRRLDVVPDRTTIRADDTDLSFVTIEIRDEQGILATTENRPVTVTVEGPGVLQGFGSARPDNPERYDTDTHHTFDGRILAVVRPTGAGPITVTATSAGLAPVTVTVTSQECP